MTKMQEGSLRIVHQLLNNGKWHGDTILLLNHFFHLQSSQSKCLHSKIASSSIGVFVIKNL